MAPKAAFGIKKCENVLVAAVCELVELRAPFPAPAPLKLIQRSSALGKSDAVGYS